MDAIDKLNEMKKWMDSDDGEVLDKAVPIIRELEGELKRVRSATFYNQWQRAEARIRELEGELKEERDRTCNTCGDVLHSGPCRDFDPDNLLDWDELPAPVRARIQKLEERNRRATLNREEMSKQLLRTARVADKLESRLKAVEAAAKEARHALHHYCPVCLGWHPVWSHERLKDRALTPPGGK